MKSLSRSEPLTLIMCHPNTSGINAFGTTEQTDKSAPNTRGRVSFTHPLGGKRSSPLQTHGSGSRATHKAHLVPPHTCVPLNSPPRWGASTHLSSHALSPHLPGQAPAPPLRRRPPRHQGNRHRHRHCASVLSLRPREPTGILLEPTWPPTLPRKQRGRCQDRRSRVALHREPLHRARTEPDPHLGPRRPARRRTRPPPLPSTRQRSCRPWHQRSRAS